MIGSFIILAGNLRRSIQILALLKIVKLDRTAAAKNDNNAESISLEEVLQDEVWRKIKIDQRAAQLATSYSMGPWSNVERFSWNMDGSLDGCPSISWPGATC